MSAPPVVVDIHTHVFNLRYLPLKGIINSWIGKRSWYTDMLASLAANILHEITGSPFAEQAITEVGADLNQERCAQAVWSIVSYEVSQRLASLTHMAISINPDDLNYRDALLANMTQDALMRSLLELENLYSRMGGTTDGRAAARDSEKERISRQRAQVDSLRIQLGQADALDAISERFEKPVRWLLRQIAKLSEKSKVWWDFGTNRIAFFFLLLRDEKSILRSLRRSYRGNQNLKLFVHYMMDMQYAYDPPDRPYYEFNPTQLERMTDLARESKGKLIGFAAFDPRRADWKAIANKAMKLGFIGNKFYPAMGFMPCGNKDKVIEKRIFDFYKYCGSNIPIFTHCTPLGFESGAGSGVKAHPKNWRTVLEGGHSDLRLCFGHAGGGWQENGKIKSPGWFARNNDEWTSKDNFAQIVVELCKEYPNVYCEIAHMMDILQSKTYRDAFEKNFIRELTSSDGKFRFADKVMYGSDSHMPDAMNETAAYLDYFSGLLNRVDPSGRLGKQFFVANAERYLQMSFSGKV